jgi:predicted DNA-binding protein with PD1-like motif
MCVASVSLLFISYRRFQSAVPTRGLALVRMRVHALRLVPGDDVKRSILKFCADRALSSAWIITAVGSVRALHIRLANHSRKGFFASSSTSTNDVLRATDQRFEIVSLVGTVAADGASCHLHVSCANADGEVVGGHLLDDTVVFTTCEIVLGSSEDVRFDRVMDEATGFDELVVREGGGGARGMGDVDATAATGKRARRARQLEAAAKEQEAMGDRPQPPRTLFGWLVSVVVPPPRIKGEEEEADAR